MFVKAHDEELQEIERDFQVKVSRNTDDGKVTITPRKHCTVEAFNEARDAFIRLYNTVYQRVKVELFLPSDQDSPAAAGRIRKHIRKVGKTLPVLVEVSEDRIHWQVYGEERFVKEALEDLEKGHLISSWSRKVRAAESWDRKEMDKNEAGFENHLEHMLGWYIFDLKCFFFFFFA